MEGEGGTSAADSEAASWEDFCFPGTDALPQRGDRPRRILSTAEAAEIDDTANGRIAPSTADRHARQTYASQCTTTLLLRKFKHCEWVPVATLLDQRQFINCPSERYYSTEEYLEYVENSYDRRCGSNRFEIAEYTQDGAVHYYVGLHPTYRAHKEATHREHRDRR